MEQFIQDYANGYQKLSDAISGLTEEQLSFKVNEKSWSVKQIIIHLADTEIVAIHRMKQVISESNPLLTAFDQDAWADRMEYQEQDHKVYLDLFKLLRLTFVPVLQRMTSEDFARTGIHTEAGKLSLGEIVKKFVNHLDVHIEQIKRTKDGFSQR